MCHLARFSLPEELLGPLSLSALRDDTYLRLSEGYVGATEMAFLDEIFKASSALLNCLLELLSRNPVSDGDPGQASLLCMVGAATTLPDEARPGGELAALFDRFLLRVTLSPLSLAGRMQTIESLPRPREEAAEEEGEVAEAAFTTAEAASLRQQSEAVKLPPEVLAIVEQIACAEAAVAVSHDDQLAKMKDDASRAKSVSDRRLVGCASLLRLVAHTSGRAAVHALDCLILRHAMPQSDADRPESADRVTEAVLRVCAVPTPAAAALDNAAELQQRVLTHIATASGHEHPATGCSRDWRERPAGALAAAVGDAATGTEAGTARSLQSHQDQLDRTVQALGAMDAELRASCSAARRVLESHPWLAPLERAEIAERLEGEVNQHVAQVQRVQTELAALSLWLAQVARKGGDGVLMAQEGAPALLSLMSDATAALLRELLAPHSTSGHKRSGLRLVHHAGYHASSMGTEAPAPIKTFSDPKQRGAIAHWQPEASAASGGGIP